MRVTEKIALEKIANNLRLSVLQQVYYGKSGHIGGSFSLAEIMSVLYFNEMNIDEKKATDPLRDRLVLSKGHASPILYAALAEKGYFKKDELLTFRSINSNLQGHPDMKKVSGVDMTTGSLGQGLSVAVGMALSSKMDSLGFRVYSILGDGEIQEGQIWEAVQTAVKYNLDNLCAIVDVNGIQLSDKIENVNGDNAEIIESKFRNFGFNTIITNGNDVEKMMTAFSDAKKCKGKPTVIIAKTVKGKGVSFMEDKIEWHGKAPNDEEYKMAVDELVKKANDIKEKMNFKEV